MAFDLSSVTQALQNARVSPSGVTFAGKSLKLNTEDDAKEVVDAINNCKELEFLNLEGNTLGVEASKGIAKALEKHPEFKRAQWKDMFTGRMKTEIPKALQYLGQGLVTAGAKLTELDLSDNAFGPIGVEGLASLLRSSSCYALEELRLNNNGLGITGGKLLASALSDCYNSSKKEGKPLALKVFIAGRNRLENDGAKALAAVFKMIGTLEEIAMPQNGIYHVGISALSDAFTHNKNLKILNLNDNTMTEKGAEAIAKALPNLQNLKIINFGDCLLKTKGVILLANALKDGHQNLEELLLDSNEIRKNGALDLIGALANKSKLKSLTLDANMFGSEGREEIKSKLKEIGKLNVLGSLEDDESDDEEEEQEVQEEEESEESTEEEPENEDDKTVGKVIKVEDFLKNPSVKNFEALGNERESNILNEAKKTTDTNSFVQIIMKVSALHDCSKIDVVQSSLRCSENLYKELFAIHKDNLSVVTNDLLVNLGLIKSEDKKFKPMWKLEGCFQVLRSICEKNVFPRDTKDALRVFMWREIENKGQYISLKKDILECIK